TALLHQRRHRKAPPQQHLRQARRLQSPGISHVRHHAQLGIALNSHSGARGDSRPRLSGRAKLDDPNARTLLSAREHIYRNLPSAEGRHKSSPGRKSWVPSATISRPTWAPWKMQSVVFLPEKMLPSPHKPEFQSRTRAPPCCQRVGTSINNLYFRRRIHHASRYFSNLDLFFRLPGNSLSDFILWITLTGNTYHAFSGTT